MSELHLFRITFNDGEATVSRDLIDGTDPDRVTSVGLAEQLAFRLKQDRAWPSATARIVDIVWMGAVEEPSIGETHRTRANVRIRSNFARERDTGFPPEWMGMRMVG